MEKAFGEIYESIHNVKMNMLPYNTKSIIKLNNIMDDYVRKVAVNHPDKLREVLSGGSLGNDQDVRKIISTYSKIDKQKIFSKLTTCAELLSEIQANKKVSQRGGNFVLEFDSANPDVFYSSVPLKKQYMSNVYPNFFMDDMDNFLINKLYAIKMLTSGPIVNSKPFIDHVRFMNAINLKFANNTIYRFINKRVLKNNIKLMRNIIKNHADFYYKFKFTIDLLKTFCKNLYRHIGHNTLDINLITPKILAKGNTGIINLNYGLVMLNGFKILMDSLRR